MTISPRVRRLLEARSGGICEVCGAQRATNTHHRKPRGMGGSRLPEINEAANLLRLCGSGTTGCHGLIESQRETAYLFGYLVRRNEDPRTKPVWLRGSTVLLADDGSVEQVQDALHVDHEE